MVAAISQAATANRNSSVNINPNSTNSTQRPPIFNNGGQNKKPRGKQVPSRYLSPSPSPSPSSSSTTTTTTTSTSSSSSLSSSFTRRYPSPLITKSTNSGSLNTPQQVTKGNCGSSLMGLKRSQSVDKRRPVTPRPNASNSEAKQANVNEMSAATKMLITSRRSLSVSFQGEAFSLPISKAKSVTTTPQNVARKGTPERKRVTPVRDQRENSRNVDQYRWPGTKSSREGNSGSCKDRSQLLCRSLDCGEGDFGVTGSGLSVVNSLRKSMIVDDSRRLSFNLGTVKQNPDVNLANEYSLACVDVNVSDSDSVSSGSTSGLQELGGVGEVCKGKSGSRGIAMSARFWQETNSRLRRLQDPGSPLSSSPSTRLGVPSKTIHSKRFNIDGPLASARTTASPLRGTTRPASPARGAARPASPGKLWSASSATSPMRGISSPSRVRAMSSNSTSSPSILSFSVDLLRRGKMGEDRILDAHMLRLLYNRYMQWRFVNARADATFMVQRLNAEKSLWNAWITISELRHSVTLKRIKLLLLKQKLKLTTIIKGQIAYLEEWSLLDRDHSNSLDGATEALKASTLRLPVVGNAITDVQSVKDAVGSAVDVMQTMASSICSLSSKVEDKNSLVAELVNVAANERFLLQNCTELLSVLSAFQVKECSLRTHVIQLNRLPTTRNLTTRA